MSYPHQVHRLICILILYAEQNPKCKSQKTTKEQKKKSKTKPKKSEVRHVRKKHMQKIEFGTGVMFIKKHGQVTSSVPKMLVGPQKRICFGNNCPRIHFTDQVYVFLLFSKQLLALLQLPRPEKNI